VPYAGERRFPEEMALEAVCQFIDDRGQVPLADQWAAAGLSPSEKTIRRMFGRAREAPGGGDFVGPMGLASRPMQKRLLSAPGELPLPALNEAAKPLDGILAVQDLGHQLA
jgi:hypothetical protein